MTSIAVIACIITCSYLAGYTNTIAEKTVKKILKTDKIIKMKNTLENNIKNIINDFNNIDYAKDSVKNFFKRMSREESIKFLEESLNFNVNMNS